jgi:hypothetical protein
MKRDRHSAIPPELGPLFAFIPEERGAEAQAAVNEAPGSRDLEKKTSAREIKD